MQQGKKTCTIGKVLVRSLPLCRKSVCLLTVFQLDGVGGRGRGDGGSAPQCLTITPAHCFCLRGHRAQPSEQLLDGLSRGWPCTGATAQFSVPLEWILWVLLHVGCCFGEVAPGEIPDQWG